MNINHKWVSILVFVVICFGSFGLNCAYGQETYRLDDGKLQSDSQYDPATPEGKYQAIRKAYAADKYGKTIKLADKWLKKNENHSFDMDVRMIRGHAQMAKKNYYKALYDYEYVARVYTASEQFWTALSREFEIAEIYTSGVKRKLMGMRLLAAFGESEEIYIRIQERAPGSDLGERANIALGNQYYDRKEYLSAIDAYEMFLLNYPRSVNSQQVMLRLIRANLARFKNVQYDSTCLIDAIQRIRQYQRMYPQSAQELDMAGLSKKAVESLAGKALLDAKWYTYRNEKVSAVYLFERVITDYPNTAASEQAAVLLTKYRKSMPVASKPDSMKQDQPTPTTPKTTIKVNEQESTP